MFSYSSIDNVSEETVLMQVWDIYFYRNMCSGFRSDCCLRRRVSEWQPSLSASVHDITSFDSNLSVISFYCYRRWTELGYDEFNLIFLPQQSDTPRVVKPESASKKFAHPAITVRANSGSIPPDFCICLLKELVCVG